LRATAGQYDAIITDRMLPLEDRERVRPPFVRLAEANAAASGLGLSLVAAIARLHCAQLSLEDNAPGLRVVLQFAAAHPKEAPQKHTVPVGPAPRVDAMA
jgi:hypothetical protein